MDASWSLGHFENRGIVYDDMDELPSSPERREA